MTYLKEFATQAEYDAFVESGAMVKPNVSLVNEPFGVFYTKRPEKVLPPNGVYIQHIDNKLYTTEEWTAKGFSNDEANGVAVVAEEAQFVIAKNNISDAMRWSSDVSTLVDGMFTTNDSVIAKTDFAGQENTALMLATDTSGAGFSCANYTFPNGQKGYLPALGELDVAQKNKSAINAMMTAIGGNAFNLDRYWSSTQYMDISAWPLFMPNGSTSGYGKSNTFDVRAFAPLTL